MADKLLLYNVAKMYYADQLGQQQIANITGISRPQISRMLKEAKQSGIVEIRLRPPYEFSGDALTKRLKSVLHLDQVHVVDASDYPASDRESRSQLVTRFAADYLSGQFPSMKRVGVGWGSTIYRMVLAMQHQTNPMETCFVPMVGNAGFSEPYYQTNSIVDRIAEKCKAEKVFINAPAFVPNESVLRYMVDMNGLDKTDSIWDGLDCALFSIGVPLRLNKVIMAYLQSVDMLDEIQERESVCDILGRFIDQDGRLCVEDERIRCVTIPIEKLLRIPRRACVAYFEEKAEGILVACRMKAVSELITDSYTAMEILYRSEKER